MDLAPAGEYQYLGRKTLALFILERCRIAVVLLILSGGSFLAFSANIPAQYAVFGKISLNLHGIAGLATLACFGGFFIALGLAALVGWLVYVNYRFMVGEDSFKVKRGILNKEEVAIPFRQIQDATIDRDLSFQMWGLSKLTILTAGHEEQNEKSEAEGILPAIDKNLAEQLQEVLLQKANVEKVVEADKNPHAAP